MKIGNINLFKIAALLLALLMSLSAVACGGDTGEGGETNAPPRFEGEAVSVGDTVTMGVYFDDNAEEMTALTWKVIKVEKDRALVITEECIDQLPFDETAYKPGATVNWETCSLREYLNGEFYEMIFSGKDKKMILNGEAEDAVAISTAANIRTDLGACADTYDKVFLLSADEAEEIFADDEARKAVATVYAEESGARVETGGIAAWWLRTMGETYDRAAVVSHSGEINYTGYNINFGSAAVRPCMWIATNTDYKEANPVVSLKNAQVGSRVGFGTFEQDGNTENGAEQLVWKVIAAEGDKLLLVTENVISMQKFSKSRVDSWETSLLREWMNGDFVASFSEKELAKIADTVNAPSANPETGAKNGKETTDKVFALSIDELTRYFPEQSARTAEPTAVALAEGVSVDPNYKTSGYWTRDLGSNGQNAAYVYYYGGFNYEGVHIRNTEYIGARPAIWVEK